MLFAFMIGCALHTNIGIVENNQPVLQVGMDVLPETIYDAFDTNTTPEQTYQSISHITQHSNASELHFVQNTTSTYVKRYLGWGGQTMFLIEPDHTLLGLGVHRSIWYSLQGRLWLTSRLGMQMAQMKIESDQLTINFLSPYSDIGFSYLISPATALSLKGYTQSNLFLVSHKNSINYGIIFGMSKGIHPIFKH